MLPLPERACSVLRSLTIFLRRVQISDAALEVSTYLYFSQRRPLVLSKLPPLATSEGAPSWKLPRHYLGVGEWGLGGGGGGGG